MSNADSKYVGSLVHYSKEFSIKASEKYSFEFTIHGVKYRAWYDPKREKTCFDGGEKTEPLAWLGEKLDQLMLVINMSDHIHIVDLHKFACKHLQAKIKVLEVLIRAPISEQQRLDEGDDTVAAFEEFLETVKVHSNRKPN
jgi:hypothetical protein